MGNPGGGNLGVTFQFEVPVTPEGFAAVMPSRMLTEAAIRSAQPREKAYKLLDSGGLFVLVNPDGSRWWRFKYRYGGTERGISFGVHPLTTLKLARQKT